MQKKIIEKIESGNKSELDKYIPIKAGLIPTLRGSLKTLPLQRNTITPQ
jgi:hypothetical protein